MFNYVHSDPLACEFIPVAPEKDLPAGERLFLEIENQPLVVFNLAGGLYCVADLCSHDNGPLGEGDLDGYEVVCPRHGARFDIRDGKATALPAVKDIPAYPVRIHNGMIEIGFVIPTRSGNTKPVEK